MKTVHALYHEAFAGMDPSAPMECYEALQQLGERATRAERKWHGWHRFTGTYGLTCPGCQGVPA